MREISVILSVFASNQPLGKTNSGPCGAPRGGGVQPAAPARGRELPQGRAGAGDLFTGGFWHQEVENRILLGQGPTCMEISLFARVHFETLRRVFFCLEQRW